MSHDQAVLVVVAAWGCLMLGAVYRVGNIMRTGFLGELEVAQKVRDSIAQELQAIKNRIEILREVRYDTSRIERIEYDVSCIKSDVSSIRSDVSSIKSEATMMVDNI